MTNETGYCGLCDGLGGGRRDIISLSFCPPLRLCLNVITSSYATIPLSPTISPFCPFPWSLQELQKFVFWELPPWLQRKEFTMTL